MLWYYAKGKPRDEVQADQHLVISWHDEVRTGCKPPGSDWRP